MTHTPLKLSETCDHRPAIMDANGHNIASWDLATIELFGDPRPAIVTACNAHDELVAALKDILEYTGGADSALDDEYVMDRAANALAKAEKGA